MKIDPKRRTGFYWVRFEGLVMVGEWLKDRKGSYWQFTGCAERFVDHEVCELLSARLTTPAARPDSTKQERPNVR